MNEDMRSSRSLSSLGRGVGTDLDRRNFWKNHAIKAPEIQRSRATQRNTVVSNARAQHALLHNIKEFIKLDGDLPQNLFVAGGINPERDYSRHGRPGINAAQVAHYQESGTKGSPDRGIPPLKATRFLTKSFLEIVHEAQADKDETFDVKGRLRGGGRTRGRTGARVILTLAVPEFAQELALKLVNRIRQNIDTHGLKDTGTMYNAAYATVDKAMGFRTAGRFTPGSRSGLRILEITFPDI